MVETIVTVKDLNSKKNLGGIGNIYQCLQPIFSKKITYQYIGRRYNDKKPIALRLLSDYYEIWKKLKGSTILFVNPSLNRNCLPRDGISALIARIKRKQLIVFFHGWAPEMENKVDKSRMTKLWLSKTLLKADHIIVLASGFKKKLKAWGFKGSITVETTLVDEELLKDFDYKLKRFENTEILFLSRIEKDKGIFEAVDAINLLSVIDKSLRFNIAGNGTAFDDLREYVRLKDYFYINLIGYVKGREKINCFQSASLFIFPSKHEGMPLSVLEAMAFGLPVITTRVGGIPDFFEDGKMGLLLDSLVPEHIAEKIQYLLERPELMKEMSEYNYNYAKEHFYSGKVAARLEKIIDDIINSNYKKVRSFH